MYFMNGIQSRPKTTRTPVASLPTTTSWRSDASGWSLR